MKLHLLVLSEESFVFLLTVFGYLYQFLLFFWGGYAYIIALHFTHVNQTYTFELCVASRAASLFFGGRWPWMRYMGGTSDWKGLERSLAKFMLNLSHSDWKAEVSVEGHRRCYQEQKFWKFKTAQSWDLCSALTLLKLCPRKLWTDQFKISYYCFKLTSCNSDSTHTSPGERWHRKNLDQGNQTQLFQSKKK